MGRWLARLAAAVFGAGLAGAAVLAIGWHLVARPGPSAEATTVIVAKGTGTRAIAAQLEAAGVVDHRLLVLIGASVIGRGESLKAGEYTFPAAVSARGAVETMQSGRAVVRRFTAPEGMTTARILALLRETESLDGEIGEPPAEGSLLPETYHYSFGDSRADLVRRMQEAMQRVVDTAWETRAPDLPLADKDEAVVLASIVERETGVAAERPRVAAVFINRLRRGMRLQSDPTVVYGLSDGLGDIGRPLTKADLATPTPFNTYVVDRLPPTPIANPGAAAIAAVLRPAESDELYFVADGNGGHAFARTLAEHNRNVARWRRIERERRDQ